MAQGDLTVFEEFALMLGDGTFDLDTQSFKIALIANNTVPTAADATPILGDYTEVTGTGYTAGGEALTTTYTEAGGVGTFDATGAPAASWTQNGAGPTNIYYALIYAVGTFNTLVNPCVCFIDMTADGGTTPISLQAGDITWTPHASGILTVTVA